MDGFTRHSDGVWHPDSLAPEMGWKGSGCNSDTVQQLPAGNFNPFASIDDKLRVISFTEQLGAVGAEPLQWAMPQHGSTATAADRGNLAIARQNLRPPWLSKPGFLAFGALRSYPLGQLRQLCTALHERSLPLGHAAVGMLVRQALYHLGDLCPPGPTTASVSQLWRTGWTGSSDVLHTLRSELSKLADELDNTPREHDAVLLLGEMAA